MLGAFHSLPLIVSQFTIPYLVGNPPFRFPWSGTNRYAFPPRARSPDDEGLSRGRDGSAELDRRSPVSRDRGRSPSPSPSPRGSPRGGRGSPQDVQYDAESDNQGNSIHCGGLPRDMTEEELREKMSAYGRITSCSIPFDPHTRESRGFGFITFSTVEEATRAVEGCREGSIRVEKV